MALISESDQEHLRETFAQMTQPVRLVFFALTVDGESCEQTREILGELPPLSANIAIEEVDFLLDADRAIAYGIDRVPAIAVVGRTESGAERDSKIRFLGTPSGYEFVSLIRAILLVGGGRSQLSSESRMRLAAVDRPMTVHVFTTPTCPHCPRAVNLAHEMAWANPLITAYAVEVTEYPDLASRYHVTGVPKTVVDDEIEILGAVPEAAFVEQALAAFAAEGDAHRSDVAAREDRG